MKKITEMVPSKTKHVTKIDSKEVTDHLSKIFDKDFQKRNSLMKNGIETDLKFHERTKNDYDYIFDCLQKLMILRGNKDDVDSVNESRLSSGAKDGEF
jgi:hypothetical protein